MVKENCKYFRLRIFTVGETRTLIVQLCTTRLEGAANTTAYAAVFLVSRHGVQIHSVLLLIRTPRPHVMQVCS